MELQGGNERFQGANEQETDGGGQRKSLLGFGNVLISSFSVTIAPFFPCCAGPARMHLTSGDNTFFHQDFCLVSFCVPHLLHSETTQPF